MGAVTHTKKTRMQVINAFRHLGTVGAACQAVGVSRDMHYIWLKRHPDYREAFEAAAGPVGDLILEEVVQRGMHGWEEPVFSGGKRALDFLLDEAGNVVVENGKPKAVPAVIRKKSDACLLALAAARVPGFNPRIDHRLTDQAGKDKDLKIIVEYEDRPPRSLPPA